MTHTPTLPNGFSRDFSEALPNEEEVLVWAKYPKGGYFSVVAIVRGDRVWAYDFTFEVSLALCWCPIPTPGDAVLKELAEKANG